jgi:hypothetical protein
MSAGKVMGAAWHAMAGTIGEMALALERKQPVPKAQVIRWIMRLRKAADILEELTK